MLHAAQASIQKRISELEKRNREINGVIKKMYEDVVKGMNINTVREMVGHADERTTMNSYCYDRHTKDERKEILEKALQG